MPRPVAYVVLLLAGVVSLPVVAAFVDGEGAENWILPAMVAEMAVVGALVGVATPELAGAGAETPKRAAVGAVIGVVCAGLGLLLFFLLLNGFDGA